MVCSIRRPHTCCGSEIWSDCFQVGQDAAEEKHLDYSRFQLKGIHNGQVRQGWCTSLPSLHMVSPSVFSDLPPTFWATTTLKFKYSMSTTTAIQDQLGQPVFPPHLPSPLPFLAIMKLPPANTHPPSIPNSITLPLLSLLALLPCCHSHSPAKLPCNQMLF